MYRLFIYDSKTNEEIEIELPSNFSVSLNKTQIDYSNPQALKVGYSSSINIEGTPRNKSAFKNMQETSWLDFYKGISANLKNPYKLYYNGGMFSSGYMVVNKITNTPSKTIYNITLYDTIGDELYKMFYNEDNSLKTLADLNYGLHNENETLTYDHNYLLYSWMALMGDYNVKGPNGEYYNKDGITSDLYKNSLQSLITPIPCYSGLYDNFDNNKILVSATDANGNTTFENPNVYDELTKSYIDSQLPLKNELRNHVDKDKTYDTYGGWELFETERDLMNFEVPELIANRTPLGVNLGKAFRTICDNSNFTYDTLDEELGNKGFLNKTYFMLKEIPQTYGNISESDKQFYPSELYLRSPWQSLVDRKNLSFNNYDNPTEVLSTNVIEGGKNAHIKLSPSYVIPKYQKNAFTGQNDINSVYGYSFSAHTKQNTWYFSEIQNMGSYRNAIEVVSNITISVIYYIIKAVDKITNEEKVTIYPLLSGNMINYDSNYLADEDLKWWVKKIVEFRTENIFFGHTWPEKVWNGSEFVGGREKLPERYSIDYRYLMGGTWSKNIARQDGNFEFIRNEIDIYQKGFDNDYDLTISTKSVTILNPCFHELFGRGQDDEYWNLVRPVDWANYNDFNNIIRSSVKLSMFLKADAPIYDYSRILFKGVESQTYGDEYWLMTIDRTNSRGTGYNDLRVDTGDYWYPQNYDVTRPTDDPYANYVYPRSGFYKLNLNGLYVQTDAFNSSEIIAYPYYAANVNTNFKVLTYVGSEDINIATISKDILKQVNVKDIFLNTIKMLNLTLVPMTDYKNSYVNVYDGDEFVEKVDYWTWTDKMGKKEYSDDNKFDVHLESCIDIINRLDFYEQRDIDGTPKPFSVTEFDDNIDTASLEVQQVVIESSEYDYKLKPVDTYAEAIQQNHTIDYETKKDTYNYNIKTDIIDVLKDVTFKTALDYKLKSVWFNGINILGDRNHQYLAFNKGARFTQTLFDTAGEEVSTIQVPNSGALYALKNLEISQFVEDTSSRLCMFNKDSSSADFENCLVCYNGFEERKVPITITDDIPAAQQINNNFCYVLYPRRGTTNRGKVVWDVNLGLLKDADDVYFELLNVPLFSNNVDSTVLGYTDLDKEDTEETTYYNLYDKYFVAYLESFFPIVYSTDYVPIGNKVTCNANFNSTNIHDIFNRIYFFFDKYWVVNKLTSFNIEKQFNKAEFASIDLGNFLQHKIKRQNETLMNKLN